MKHLTDYLEPMTNKTLNKFGAFFAFNMDQFNEKKKPETVYTQLFGGLICPKDNAKDCLNEMSENFDKAVQLDIAENGIDKIIVRELYNHECFYTGSTEDVVDKLRDYPGITAEMINNAYWKEYKTVEL